jgi:hypothetical protein
MYANLIAEATSMQNSDVCKNTANNKNVQKKRTEKMWGMWLLVEPVLPLTAASSRTSINRASDNWTTLRTIDQVTSKGPVLKLEALLRFLVLDAAVALHLVAVEILLRCVTSVAVQRDGDWVGKGAWPLVRVWTCLSGALQQRLAGFTARPYLDQEAGLRECASQVGCTFGASSIRVGRVTTTIGTVYLLQKDGAVEVGVEAIMLVIRPTIV